MNSASRMFRLAATLAALALIATARCHYPGDARPNASGIDSELAETWPLATEVVGHLDASAHLSLRDAKARVFRGDAELPSLVSGMPDEGDGIYVRLVSSWAGKVIGGSLVRPDRFVRCREGLVGEFRRLSAAYEEGEIANCGAGLGESKVMALEPGKGGPDTPRIVGAPWLDIMAARDASESKWRVDVKSALQSIRVDGSAVLEGENEVMGVDSWATAHVIHLPELPCAPGLWIDAADGFVEAEVTGSKGGLISVDLRAAAEGKIFLKDWLATTVSRYGIPRDYFDAFGFRGDGVAWSWVGGGEMVVSRDAGFCERFRLTGILKVDVSFEWSYLWDAPELTRYSGDVRQVWMGEFRVVGGDVTGS